ncbi:MAG: DNA primase [Dehalococcoidia bacterium]|nr:DNA primase [Dehalococcoidia bacterium]
MTALDDVKRRLNIVDVVSDYVALKKAGRNFKAVCPFHSEKTPSFYVFPDKQSWHCFGACATGGDAIGFVMKRENLSFNEAMEKLARRTGVDITRASDPGKMNLEKRLRALSEDAGEFFQSLLLNSPSAESVRQYVAKRGITAESLKNFGVGWAPDGFNMLLSHLERRGYESREIVAAGLALVGEQGSVRDRFRNRLMFTIRDDRGRIVGFGGRALDPDDEPKYMNSPQTVIFDKSSILYAIDHAKDSIRETNQVVIVEGYMDALIAHQQGFHNVVASMGTSLTDLQVSILKPLAGNFVMALDPDAAGDEANLRGLEILFGIFVKNQASQKAQGLTVTEAAERSLKVMNMPRGKDPDEIILESRDKWTKLVAAASPLLDYIIDSLSKRVDLKTDNGKNVLLERLLPMVARTSIATRERYIEKLSHIVGLDERVLRDYAINSTRGSGKNRIAVETFAAVSRFLSVEPLEEHLLHMLILYPELRDSARSIALETLNLAEHREILQAILEHPSEDDMVFQLDGVPSEIVQNLMNKLAIPSNISERRWEFQTLVGRLEDTRLLDLKKREAEMFDAHQDASEEELELIRIQAAQTNEILKNRFADRRRTVDV